MKRFTLLLFAFCFMPLLMLAQNKAIKSELHTHSRQFSKSAAPAFDEALAPFYHGVASGDPLQDRVIIWTRVAPEEVGDIAVKWHVATDPELTNVVQEGEFTTNADRDYTVKIDVTGLEAGTTYYYVFSALGVNSLIGRTRTAPEGDVEGLKFGVVSCSHYQQGYFNAYGNMAKRTDLDAIIHLGDYIYEYGIGDDFIDTMVRAHGPEHEILTLEDYRMRYSTYRLDKDLRAAHQQNPFITIWDDHETANDAWRDGAENHNPEDGEGDWEERKNTGIQVYFEWMPIRELAPPLEKKIYRKFDYGNLVDLIMLDTRLEGRDQQSEDEEVINDPNRQLLGETQLNWYLDQLSNSTAKWKVIGNQIIFSPIDLLGFIPSSDMWEGYPAERQKVTDHIINNNIDDIVVITGDFHIGLAFDVVPDPYTEGNYDPETGEGAIAVEFAGTSVTSGNVGESGPDVTPDIVNTLGLSANPHGKFVNSGEHGYFILNLDEEKVQADYYWTRDKFQQNDEEYQEQSWFSNTGENFLQSTTTPVPAPADAPALAPDSPPEFVVGIADAPVQQLQSSGIAVLSNYPNPATTINNINYALAKPQFVKVRLLDISGKEVSVLLSEQQLAGIYTLQFDTSELANGTYIYRFETESGSVARTIVVQH